MRILHFLLVGAFLILLSCEKKDIEDIVVIPDPPSLIAYALTNGELPYNSYTSISYTAVGFVDSVLVNSRKMDFSEGVYQTPNLKMDSTFLFIAYGPGGTDSSTVYVMVAEPLPPTVSFTVTPSDVPYLGQSKLSWRCTYAHSCTVNGVSAPISGSITTTPLVNDTTFTVRCVGDGGTAFLSKTVFVGEKPLEVLFMEIGVNLTWKLIEKLQLHEDQTEWQSLPLNGLQVSFYNDGRYMSFEQFEWGSLKVQETWYFSGTNIYHRGHLGKIETLNTMDLTVFWPRVQLGTEHNGEAEYVQQRYIYKKLSNTPIPLIKP